MLCFNCVCFTFLGLIGVLWVSFVLLLLTTCFSWLLVGVCLGDLALLLLWVLLVY